MVLRQARDIPVSGARSVIALSEGGATLPFIARYRKEQTGNLDEVAIQTVLEAKAPDHALPRAGTCHNLRPLDVVARAHPDRSGIRPERDGPGRVA
ncbi:MAG: hypothetical protein JOZ69_10380 [Myxococcales bacterium]|nr:hypothetical protein [Myxococcales bacterium]